MSKLKIEELNDALQLEKTAEEAQMEKIASIIEVIDEASALTEIGAELYKTAEELGNENLAALASDIYQTGERMGAALTKMASEDGSTLVESLEIAEDLNKIASVMAEIADDVQDEAFSKMASAVIEISNGLTDEANEVIETMDIDKEAGTKSEAVKAFFEKLKGKTVEHAGKAKEKLMEHASKVKEYAKEHPKKAAAYATGAAAGLAAAGYAGKKLHDKK